MTPGRTSSNKNTIFVTQLIVLNSVAFSPQTNYTDWATVTCWRNLVPTFVDREVSRGQHGGSLTVVNFSFLDQNRYFFFQVAPHLSSQGLSEPHSRSTATQKIWQHRESKNPGPLGLQPGNLTTRPQRWSEGLIVSQILWMTCACSWFLMS
jgi:hypothetical protein